MLDPGTRLWIVVHTDAENEVLELQLDMSERQAALDSLNARHKALCYGSILL